MIGVKLSHVQVAGILEWTGPTSGSQNMETNPILYFVAAPGVYTITVKRSMTLTWEICGNGAHGRNGGEDQAGGDGGGCGEVRTATFTMVPGQSYVLALQGSNVNAFSYLDLGATRYVAAGGTSSRNAPTPGVGTLVYPGRQGGSGSGFAQVGDGRGEDGSYGGGYSPGSGGGGGSASSNFCGSGGDGGGAPGGAGGPPMPGGFVPCLGGTGGSGVGWRVFIIGAGGGGGNSGNSGGPFPGGGSLVPGKPGAPAGAVTTFVSLA